MALIILIFFLIFMINNLLVFLWASKNPAIMSRSSELIVWRYKGLRPVVYSSLGPFFTKVRGRFKGHPSVITLKTVLSSGSFLAFCTKNGTKIKVIWVQCNSCNCWLWIWIFVLFIVSLQLKRSKAQFIMNKTRRISP